MKRLFLLTVAAIAALGAMAQDLIVTRDSKRIEAKITEVSSSEIRYKEWNNQDGPTFVLRTDEINTIIYQNGTVKTFEHGAAAPANYNSSSSYSSSSYSAPATPAGYIVKDDDDFYTLGNKRMSEDEYIDFIRSNCKEAWDYYESGCNLWSSGWKLFGCGLGFITCGAVLLGVGNGLYLDGTINYDGWLGCYIPGAIILTAGSGCLAGSVPCLIIGSIRRNNSHEVYNESCGRRTSAVTFGIQGSQNGLGLAINF